MRTRTKNRLGNELGEFTEETKPTLEAAEKILETATSKVVGKIGTAEPCSDELAGDAAACIHLLAAMMIELTYFPEQVDSNRSPYEKYKELYDEDLATLTEAVAEQCGTGTGEADDGSILPLWNYGNGPLLGNRTRF